MHINKHVATRAIPFIFYIVVMALSGVLADMGIDVRWIYALRAGGTALLMMFFWRDYVELAWPPKMIQLNYAISIFIGFLVFVLWINLDQKWMLMGTPAGYDPRSAEGGLNILMVVVRIAGAALIVPLMEELFWRSFLMRWIDRADFLAHSPESVSLKAIFLSSLLFAFEHTYWLAGLIAGLAYGWLYVKTRNLWAPVIAHALTNGVLAMWVLSTGRWDYW